MVDQDPQPTVGLGLEVSGDGGQVVDAAEELDHDPDIAQVISPDPLDQLRVVLALHVDAACPGDPGPGARRRDRAGSGPDRSPGLRHRPDEYDPLALQQEGPAQREGAALPESVLQDDRVLLARHHGTAEVTLAVLDHEAALGRNPRRRHWPARRRRQHVLVVLPAAHRFPSWPGDLASIGHRLLCPQAPRRAALTAVMSCLRVSVYEGLPRIGRYSSLGS